MNTDAAEALQALCPMNAIEAREIYRDTGSPPAGWEILSRVRGDGKFGEPSQQRQSWEYLTGGDDNWDIIRRKPILTEAP